MAVTRWSIPARARNSATATPIRTSKKVSGAGGAVPGGPVGKVEVIAIAKSLAAYVAVSDSLTYLDVRGNKLDDETKTLLRDAVKDKSGFELKV